MAKAIRWEVIGRASEPTELVRLGDRLVPNDVTVTLRQGGETAAGRRRPAAVARFAVRDGVIEKMFIEPDKPGDPFEVSDADTMMHYLDADYSAEPDVFILTKPGCGHCARAKSMLREKGMRFAEVTANPKMLRAVSKTTSTPQVFVDGKLIGGADQLAEYLAG